MADQDVTETLGQAESHEEPFVVTVERLAALPTHEYEQARKAEAKRMKMRASVLDREVNATRKNGQDENDLGLFEPEPWPEEVDGDDLLDRIVGAICRRVVMPPHAAEATALWVVHCHAFECWRHTPRLAVLAPEKECGKSTLLDVLLPLVPRAVKTESRRSRAMAGRCTNDVTICISASSGRIICRGLIEVRCPSAPSPTPSASAVSDIGESTTCLWLASRFLRL
jgi:hypothetical protein